MPAPQFIISNNNTSPTAKGEIRFLKDVGSDADTDAEGGGAVGNPPGRFLRRRRKKGGGWVPQASNPRDRPVRPGRSKTPCWSIS